VRVIDRLRAILSVSVLGSGYAEHGAQRPITISE